MAWIEFHPGKIKKLKKFSDLRRMLQWNVNETLGFLGSFWGEVIDLREDGDISGWNPEYICDLTGIGIDPERVWDALVQCRWIDAGPDRTLIHDWLETAGRYLEAKYRTSNPEILHKAWTKHGKEYLKVPGAKNSSGWTATRIKVLERDQHRCVYCGAKDVSFEIDHVIPFSKGGTNSLENLVTACRSCNRSKGDRLWPDNRQTKDAGKEVEEKKEKPPDVFPSTPPLSLPPKERKEEIFLSEPPKDAVGLGELLKSLILRNNPKARAPASVRRWAETADLMYRIDKRQWWEIRKMIVFSQNDAFWKSNILSMEKLRLQFDQLWMKSSDAKGNSNGQNRERTELDYLMDKEFGPRAKRKEKFEVPKLFTGVEPA